MKKVHEHYYHVRVYLIAGRNLVPKDRSGTSDPYAILTIDRSTYKPPRSKTIYKTCDPTWHQAFDVKVPKNKLQTGTLIIDLYDKDFFDPGEKALLKSPIEIIEDDSMGCVKIPLKDLKGAKKCVDGSRWRRPSSRAASREIFAQEGQKIRVMEEQVRYYKSLNSL